MKYALNFPNFGDYSNPRELAELALDAEKAGWDGFFLWDHMTSSSRLTSSSNIPFVDPWVALSAIAMKTESISIGTWITPLPRRRPWKVARETVSIDHLSNGRLILGVGLGAPDFEFIAYGEEVDPGIRAQKLDEGLKIIDELREKFPDNLKVLNNKVYFHLYRQEKEEAIEAGKLLTELDPNDGNFHDSFAEILTEFGEYEKALKEIQKALELEPYGWFSYNSYLQRAKCYKETGKYDLARESLEEGVSAINTCYCDIQMRKEWKEKKIKLLAEMDELEANS